MVRLKELREERSLSTRELAKMAGITPVTITRIEKGRRFPQPKTARQLAAALGVSPAVLLGRKVTVSDD
jgi:transcriptional regulator with XRE-family HTH domain